MGNIYSVIILEIMKCSLQNFQKILKKCFLSTIMNGSCTLKCMNIFILVICLISLIVRYVSYTHTHTHTHIYNYIYSRIDSVKYILMLILIIGLTQNVPTPIVCVYITHTHTHLYTYTCTQWITLLFKMCGHYLNLLF